MNWPGTCGARGAYRIAMDLHCRTVTSASHRLRDSDSLLNRVAHVATATCAFGHMCLIACTDAPASFIPRQGQAANIPLAHGRFRSKIVSNAQVQTHTHNHMDAKLRREFGEVASAGDMNLGV